MEGEFAVFLGKQQSGKVTVQRQGLYYGFSCRCRLPDSLIYRLWLHCGDTERNLGVLAPVGGGYGLDCKIPVKHIGEGEPEFYLKTGQNTAALTILPVYPEEPFAYLSRLKDAYLIRKDGMTGIVLK